MFCWFIVIRDRTVYLGKILEGSASQMITSLSVLNDFPTHTLIFPGHEYAELNLSFAVSLEKDNEVLEAMSKTACEKRTIRLPFVSLKPILQSFHFVEPCESCAY